MTYSVVDAAILLPAAARAVVRERTVTQLSSTT
jgi:hypothetical protein